MSGAFNQKRDRKRPQINIAPLIDVMFLLLIFFMVSSTFRDNMGIDLDLPQAATAEAAVDESPTIIVSEGGQIIFEGAEIPNMEKLREKLEALYEENPDTRLILRADNEAHFGKAIGALDLAREIGFKQVVVPTQQPKPENEQ